MAPELINKEPHDFKVDIWALGVLLYEMLYKNTPFRGHDVATVKKSAVEDLSLPKHEYQGAVDLVQKILKNNPTERLSLEQIFDDPWILACLSRVLVTKLKKNMRLIRW